MHWRSRGADVTRGKLCGAFIDIAFAMCSERVQHTAEEPGGHELSRQPQHLLEGRGHQHPDAKRRLGPGQSYLQSFKNIMVEEVLFF